MTNETAQLLSAVYLCRFGVFLAVVYGSIHHVGEGSLCLLPLSCLQTTVGVDPELIWLEVPRMMSA